MKISTFIFSVIMASLCVNASSYAADEDNLKDYFGFGIAVMHFKDPHIEEAVVRSGIVQISQTVNERVTPWLQTQYIFDGVWENNRYVKPGIYLGVGIGAEGNALDTFGIGGMLSMKRTPWKEKNDTRALNIGFGFYTTKVKHLAKDAIEGQPLPAGVESVPLLTETDKGMMLSIGFSI